MRKRRVAKIEESENNGEKMKEIKEVEEERKNKVEDTRTPVKQKILRWEVALKGQNVIVTRKAGQV